MKILYVTASAIALGGLNMSVAHAQEASATAAPTTAEQPGRGVEDIVVTAQKRGENLQDVPIAITAFSSDDLQAKGITNVLEFTQATPTISAAPFPTSTGVLFFFMRGMGVGNPGQITTDPAVGIYENGIYNPRPVTYIFDVLEPERVEVLRGPQGTLYGRNTTGGAVNIVSRPPSGEFEVRQLVSYASRNQYRSVTNFDFPAIGGLSLKGTLAVGGDDGFMKNVRDPAVPDGNDFGIERHVAGRIAARLDVGDDFTADYSFMVGKQKSTPLLAQSASLQGIEIIPGLPYSYEPYQAYRPISLPFSTDTFRDHGLTLEWRASDALTLRSITGFRHFGTDRFNDLADIFFIPIAVSNSFTSDVVTQEVQAVGSLWDDRIKYAAGLYYFKEDIDNFDFDVSFFFLPPQQQTIALNSVSKAAYAQLTFTPPILDDRLDLTVGARYTSDRKISSRTNAGAPTEAGVTRSDRFNPSATLLYRWSDSTNSYAKVTTGYRAGGFNEAAADYTDTFAPETLTSYEVGLKTDLFDRSVRANFAAFYNKFKDIQLPLAVDPNDPTNNPVFNAGRATIKGLEADITIAPVDSVTLNINYAYLDAEIDRVELTPGAPNIANLFVLPFAPKHTLSVSGEVVLMRTEEGPLTLHADYNHKSSNFNSAGAGPAVPGRLNYLAPARDVVNARLTLEREWFGKPAQISLFVKNLFDSHYKTFVSAVGSQAGYSNQNFFLAPPRSIGAEVAFAF